MIENLSYDGGMENQNNTPIDEAIKAAGGITSMSRALALSGHAVIQQWKRNGIPDEHCPAIERLTGVTCERLRPDLTWHRVPDAQWPRAGGRPLLDFTEATKTGV